MDAPDTRSAKVLYSNFIKYEALDKYIKGYFFNMIPLKSDIVNVYIDVYQMLTYLYRADYIEDPINIASCVINHAIHYRNYFKKYCGKYANVFLVYSPASITHCLKFCPQWNCTNIYREEKKSVITEQIRQALDLVKIITPYLPDIYFKMGTFEVPVIISDMINKFSAKGMVVPNLVISQSQYAFQIPAYIPNTCLIYSKQHNKSDTSEVSVGDDCVRHYINQVKLMKNLSPDINKQFMTLVMICIGIPKRDIDSLFTYTKTLKAIEYLTSNYKIPTVDELIDAVLALSNNMICDSESIGRRYSCIDMTYQLQLYNTMPESKEFSYLSQLQDIKALYDINDKYFKDNPITINML